MTELALQLLKQLPSAEGWAATDEEIRTLFARHGTVVQATVMIDNRGRSKGYGLVDMPKSEAGRAADALNGYLIDGRPLKVRLSR